MELRYREEEVRDIPETIEELIPFLTQKHADLLQKGAINIQYSLNSSYEYGDAYAYLEISYRSPKTEEEKKAEELNRKRLEMREKETYEKLRKKFEKKTG